MTDKALKATVLVRLKGEVLDPQGDAVRRAMVGRGFEGLRDVRIGKLIEISFDPSETDPQALSKRLQSIADELLANPVVEDFEVTVHDDGR